MTDVRGEKMKNVDCRVFEDQLDALVEGQLPPEGVRQMRRHAESCPDCAMQLKVQEHLALPSLEELEERVPDEMVASMWDRVRRDAGPELGAGTRSVAEVEAAAGGQTHGRGREREHFRRPGQAGDNGSGPGPFGWLVPTLAAATVALLFATGFLFWEMRQLRAREDVLAQQVVEQRRWLAELEVSAGADPVARTAALAGRSPWVRALSRQETISLEGLRSLLRAMPGDRVLLEAERLEAVRRSPAPLTPPLLREVLARIQGDDGVRARDLLRALETLDVGPETTVPVSELVDLVS